MTDTIKVTERTMLDALRRYHTKPGNGGAGEYAFLTHVRNAAGFDAGRTFDAIAMSLWPSRGLVLTAYEVKVSRSDWLRELKDPEKAEAACALADQFAIVAPAGIVKAEEVPLPWGWLELGPAGQVRARKRPPMLRDVDHKKLPPIDRSFLVAMLRSAGAVPASVNVAPEEIRNAREEERQRADEMHKATLAGWIDRTNKAEKALLDFERASGVRIHDRTAWAGGDPARAGEVGAALRLVLNGDQVVDRAKERLDALADQLRSLADTVADGKTGW